MSRKYEVNHFSFPVPPSGYGESMVEDALFHAVINHLGHKTR